MSDRDILIVDDDVKLLRDRARALTDAGWSVASYTFTKLDTLCQRGALFIQHIKLESSILVDRDNRLAQTLATFRPRLSYADEIRNNDQLASLAGVIPHVPKGRLLAADILYVTVRNFGVLSLAERGVHAYAFGSVVEALEAEGLIVPGGAGSLAPLRFLKCLYRAGETGPGIDARAHAIVQRALAALPPAHFPGELRIVPPEDIVLAPACSISTPAYFQLRDLERRLVALQAFECSRPHDERLRDLTRWIENPRAYVGLSSRLAPDLCRIMTDRFQNCQFSALSAASFGYSQQGIRAQS
jgi:hypothetical protein